MSYEFWLDLVADHSDKLALVIGLIACLETLAFIGLAVPGVAILFALSTLAGSQQQPLLWLLFCAFAGAVIGDQISFLLGRFAGPWLLHHWPLKHFTHWVPRGQRFFDRYGGGSILIGRFVGPIRPIIPFVAGSCGMQPLRFGLVNLASAAAWAPAYLLPGYLTGISTHWLPLLDTPVLVVGVSLLSLFIAFQQIHIRLHPEAGLWRWLHRHRLHPRAVASGLLLVFSLLTLVVLTGLQLSASVQTLNTHLYELLHLLGQRLALLSNILTLAGDPMLMLALALICGVLAQLKYAQSRGWGIAIGVSAILAGNHLLKEWLQVPRPPLGAQTLGSYSFPSAHASAASAFYALFAVWLLHNRPHRVRHVGYLLVVLWILLLALSRVLLGMHWPLDVLAGVMEGFMVAALYRLWLLRQPASPPLAQPFILALIAICVGLFVAVRLLTG